MIKNAPLGFRHLLLRLINQSFQEGKLPEAWKTARIVPIPKPKKKGAFRPISLLPVMGKLMERMVLINRLRWTAEPLCNQPLGFRRGTGTSDAVATVYGLQTQAGHSTSNGNRSDGLKKLDILV